MLPVLEVFVERLIDGGSVTSAYRNSTFTGMHHQLDGVVIESLLTPVLYVITTQSIFALKGNLFHSHNDNEIPSLNVCKGF